MEYMSRFVKTESAIDWQDIEWVGVLVYRLIKQHERLVKAIGRIIEASTCRTFFAQDSKLDAAIGLARDTVALRRLDAWLDSSVAAGLPLRPPTRCQRSSDLR